MAGRQEILSSIPAIHGNSGHQLKLAQAQGDSLGNFIYFRIYFFVDMCMSGTFIISPFFYATVALILSLFLALK